MTGRARAGLFVLTLVSAAICTSLGFWQADRLAGRRADNRVAMAARALPVVDLNRPDAGADGALDQRRATAVGTWDHAHTFVLRARAEREAPGVHIVTPLRLDGRDEAVLVNRGFVPSDDAMTPRITWDEPPTGSATGYAFLIPSVPDSGTPLARGGATTWRRLDLATVRARLPYPVLEVYLHATERAERPEDASPWPVVATLRPLDDGPHLGYMVQWFMLAAASLAFGVIFLRGREGRSIAE